MRFPDLHDPGRSTIVPLLTEVILDAGVRTHSRIKAR